MASTLRPWWSGPAGRDDPPWREIGIGTAGGALLGRLLCGGARGILMGGGLGAAAGALFGLRGGPYPPDTRHHRSEGRTGTATSGSAGTGRAAPEPPSPRGDRTERPVAPSRSGAAAGPDFGSMTRAELYEEAQRLDITGRSSMNKAELLEAVRARQK